MTEKKREKQCRNQSKCEGFVGLGAEDSFPLRIPSCIDCVLFFIFKMGGRGLKFLAAKRVRNAALHGFISIIWLSPSVLVSFDVAFRRNINSVLAKRVLISQRESSNSASAAPMMTCRCKRCP